MRISESTCDGPRSCRRFFIASAAAAVWFAGSALSPPAWGQPPAAEEEATVVVGDESVVSEEGESTVDTAWKPRQIVLRDVGGKAAFIRQSSEAFEDPDQRTSLELKYYFELPAELGSQVAQPTTGTMSRGTRLDPSAKLVARLPSSTEGIGVPLPQVIGSGAGESANDVEWLDYQAGSKASLIAALLPTGENSTALLVAHVAPDEQGLALEKQLAVRELKADELPLGCQLGGLLDTWDRPKTLGGRAMFFGRVIAVLKQADGRYAVDFYGESLNPESDCRVWLWKKDSAIGRPIGIRFLEIPVKKGPDVVGSTWALAVAIAGEASQVRTIAFDYPLCRPAVMAQMQRAAQKPGATPPDLEKLVGADLLDEFARRLVNGTYR